MQGLAGQYLGLIEEFTMGDPETSEGLQGMYSSEDSPAPRPFASQEEQDYVQQAVALRREAAGGG